MDSSALGEGHRNAPSPRGGTVLVSLYSWTCVTLGVAIARLGISLLHKVDFGADDATVMAGSIVYIGATVAWQYAVNAGLGKHIDQVSPADAERYFKATYAAQLLLVLAMALGKTSSIFLVERVAAQSRRAKMFLFSMVAFWFVYSVLTLGLQCGIPKPWLFRPGECSLGGLSISVIVLNMLSDLVIAGWILPILQHLQMARSKRVTAAALFGARAVIPFAAGAQAWAAAKATESRDPTYDGFELAILTQAVSSLSLIVASLPRIKRFLSVGGSTILYPRITETEIALSTRAETGNASSRGGEPLKLVPSSTTRVTTTVTSQRSKKPKDRPQVHNDWQKFVSMGSTQDEHTSTSSLFEQQGVMRQQEVTITRSDATTGENERAE